MPEMILHVVWHGFLDTLKLLPFLFLTYLLMELLEHKAGERAERVLTRTGRFGPVIGALLGLVPQCGFSGAAASLYAGRVVTLGTMLAVFLATSDEMIPVFLSEQVAAPVILAVLGIKLLVAVLVGFVADAVTRRSRKSLHVHTLCEEEHCHCEKGIVRSALHHTLHIALFVLIINLALGAVLELVGAERIAAALSAVPFVGQVVAALIGLIPNCAASVAIATLYARGLLSAGSMLAGLLTGAGAGLLILFRTNRQRRENLLIAAALLGIGVFFGCLLDFTGLATLFGL